MHGRRRVDNADWQKREMRRAGIACSARDADGAPMCAKIASAWPREFGKTTMRQALALWALLSGWRYYPVVFRANEDTATGEMNDIVRIAENPDHPLTRDFALDKWAVEVRRSRSLKWSSEKLHLPNVSREICTYQALGACSPARGLKDNGRRPDLVMLDDIETTEGTWSKATRLRNERWIDHDIDALGKTAAIIFWQTVVSPLSLMSRCQTDPTWQSKRFAALDDDDNSTWPEMYSSEELREKRANKAPSAWLADYQNLPQANETTLFPVESWRLYEVEGVEPPTRSKLSRVSIGVDLAFTAEKSSDYTAISAWGEDGQGNKHHLTTIRGRWATPEEVIRQIRLIDEEVRADKIVVEDVSSSKHFISFAKNEIGYKVIGVSPEGLDKTARARSVMTQWEIGKVWCHKADTLIVGEMYNFRPDVKDQVDDVLDAAVYAVKSFNARRVQVLR